MSPEHDNPNAQPSAAAAAETENSTESVAAQAESHAMASAAAAGAAAAPEPASALDALEQPADPPVAAAPVAEATTAPAAEPGDESATDSPEKMDEQMMEQYAAPHQAPTEGEIIEGHVVAITDLGIVVDVGSKTEGLVPAQEFLDAEIEIRFEPGQNIEVQRTDQHRDGYAILSHLRARRRKAWEEIEKAYRGKINMHARVVDRIKGGLVVDVGVRAFLPASQVDMRPVHDLDDWNEREFPVRVLKMNRKRGNVVVSRRVVLEEDQREQREKLMASIAEGQVLTGKVKNITDYGVFVDLGGVDGLLHITDLSWGRLKHPSEAVQPGDEIQVQVLRFDREKNRVSLSRKQLIPDPWAAAAEKFPVGARVQGKVVGLTDYGAFIELGEGIEGLVHISEMTWSKRMKHPSKIVALGDTVEVVVLGVHGEQRRISLGLKQATPDPWQTLAEKYPVGTIVTGKIRNLTDFGAFVEIEEGFDGLVHVSDISWTTKVKNPADALKKGETVTARVLKIDPSGRRVSLGIKQVNDIWSDWFASHKLNDVVRGKVSRNTSFGAFVELADGIEGLCHISEIEDRKSRERNQSEPAAIKGAKPSSLLEPGQEYDFKVVKLSPNEHKIGLSYRAAQKQAERREMEEYRSSKSSSTATLGDVFYSKRNSA
jgi:small subunit ribosomal protein S1